MMLKSLTSDKKKANINIRNFLFWAQMPKIFFKNMQHSMELKKFKTIK